MISCSVTHSEISNLICNDLDLFRKFWQCVTSEDYVFSGVSKEMKLSRQKFEIQKFVCSEISRVDEIHSRMMDFIIANTDLSHFKIEYELNEQLGALPLPFSGMDKSTSAVCNFFNSGKLEKYFVM